MSRRRILITGAAGQLATDLQIVLQDQELLPLSHRDLDITDTASVRQALSSFKPDIVINTAAFHRVDKCETDPERAFRVNVIGPENLSGTCRDLSATLVHLSTDYIFDGRRRKPYLEEDEARPLNVYGISKLAGEFMIRARLERHLIVRTSALFGRAGAAAKGGNFVTAVLSKARAGETLTIVDDQRMSPTYTRHLADKIAWLIDVGEMGTVHVTDNDSCSWYEFVQAILKAVGLSADLRPTTTLCLAAPARRPAYSVLGHGRLQSLGADDLPPWPEALRQYLQQLGAA